MSNCANCGKPAHLQCGACNEVVYCDKKCQVTHWRVEHEFICKKPLDDSGEKDILGMKKLKRRLENAGKAKAKQIDASLYRTLDKGVSNVGAACLYAQHQREAFRVREQREAIMEFADSVYQELGVNETGRESLKMLWDRFETEYSDTVKQFIETGDRTILDGIDKSSTTAIECEVIAKSLVYKKDPIDILEGFQKFGDVEYFQMYLENTVANLKPSPQDDKPKQEIIEYLQHSLREGTYFHDFTFVGGKDDYDTDDDGENPLMKPQPKPFQDMDFDDDSSVSWSERKDSETNDGSGPLETERELKSRSQTFMDLKEIRWRVKTTESALRNTLESSQASAAVKFFQSLVLNQYVARGLGTAVGLATAAMSLYGLGKVWMLPVTLLNKEVSLAASGFVKVRNKMDQVVDTLKESRELFVDLRESVMNLNATIPWDNPKVVEDTVSYMVLQLYNNSKYKNLPPEVMILSAKKLFNHLFDVVSKGKDHISQAMLKGVSEVLTEMNETTNPDVLLKIAEDNLGGYLRLITLGSNAIFEDAIRYRQLTGQLEKFNEASINFMTITVRQLNKLEELQNLVNVKIDEAIVGLDEAQGAFSSNIMQSSLADMDPVAITRAIILEKLKTTFGDNYYLRTASRIGVEAVALQAVTASRSLKMYLESPEMESLVTALGADGSLIAVQWDDLLVSTGLYMIFNDHILKLIYSILRGLNYLPNWLLKRRFDNLFEPLKQDSSYISVQGDDKITGMAEKRKVLKNFLQAVKLESGEDSAYDEARYNALWLKTYDIIISSFEAYEGVFSFLAKYNKPIGVAMIASSMAYQFGRVLLTGAQHVTSVISALGADIYDSEYAWTYAKVIGPIAIMTLGTFAADVWMRYNGIHPAKQTYLMTKRIIMGKRDPSAVVTKLGRVRRMANIPYYATEKTLFLLMKHWQWVFTFLTILYKFKIIDPFALINDYMWTGKNISDRPFNE